MSRFTSKIVQFPLFVSPPAQAIKQSPISHEVQLRFTKKNFHRGVPLGDAAMRVCLVSSNPAYSITEGPNVLNVINLATYVVTLRPLRIVTAVIFHPPMTP